MSFRDYALGMSVAEATRIAREKLSLYIEESSYYRETPWRGTSRYCTFEDKSLFRIIRTKVKGIIKPEDGKPVDSFQATAGNLIDTAIAKYGRQDRRVRGIRRGTGFEASAKWDGEFVTEDLCVHSRDPLYEIYIHSPYEKEKRYIYMENNVVDCDLSHNVKKRGRGY